MKDSTHKVIHQIADERAAQDFAFPDQHLPDGTDEANAPQADYLRWQCDLNSQRGRLSWADVLHEEVWEALAETDQTRLRAELIQVAAVAARWVEDIDARAKD